MKNEIGKVSTIKTVTSKLTIGETSKQKTQERNESQPLVQGNSSVRELMFNAATVAALTAMLVAAMPASAATFTAPGQNKLLCFDGPSEGTIYGGLCSLKGSRAKGPATLDNTDGDPDGSYSGVYILNSNLEGQLLSTVGKLSFSYAAVGGTVASGGSPRISIPIDVDGDGNYDNFAFIDTLGCNNGSPNKGTLDAISDSTCTVALDDGRSYANWAAFVAANPTYQIATDTVAFVIADQPGLWTITNVTLGKSGK